MVESNAALKLLKIMNVKCMDRIPKNVPKVTWTVKVTDREFIFPGFIPVIAKQIVGHVDNSEYPLINVDIKMIVVMPANVKGPVPVLMMFGQPSFPAPAQPSPDDMETLNATFQKNDDKNRSRQ